MALRVRRRAWLWLAVVIFLLGYGALRSLFPFPYRELVEREARRNGLDPLLVVAVMRVESHFDPNARSPVGARGLMQLMPSTAAWVGRKASLGPEAAARLEDPETNIRLGCWYLGFLLRQYPRDLDWALAAYNAGQGSVGRWQRGEKAVYPETRRYMARGRRTYAVYRWLYRGRP